MKKYSFLDTVVLVNGIEIKGFGGGDDVITAERTVDSATDVVGNGGEMTVAMSSDRSGTISLNLMQTSESNAYLAGLLGIQENGTFVPIFVQYKDNGGNDLVSGTQGYFVKTAAMTRGTNPNTGDWVMKFERLDIILGGSDSL